ncbi:MAG: hypothetical protein KAX20_04045 [Candidatus Omnitrophica bacterium]|nr:hypothetical protein [Candidatus Omnitrophota bacterium]
MDNKKIWWILVIFVLLVLGIWLYSVGLKSAKKVSEEKAVKPEIFQEKEAERVIRPEKKVTIPSDYEPISPEVEGIEDFEEERKREAQRKDRGIPTG